MFWKSGGSTLLPYSNIRHLPRNFRKRLFAVKKDPRAPKVYVTPDPEDSGSESAGTGGPLLGDDKTEVTLKDVTSQASTSDHQQLVPFGRDPDVHPDRHFPEFRAYCLKNAMDHLLADAKWCTVADLQRGKKDTQGKVVKGGKWTMSSMRRTLRTINSCLRLMCRRKSPYFLTEPSRLEAVESGMYVVIGHNSQAKVSHAVGVDANRRPRVIFSCCKTKPIPLTIHNLKNLKYPIVTITDVAQLMVQQQCKN